MQTLAKKFDPFFEKVVRFGRMRKPTVIVALAGLSYALMDISLFPILGAEVRPFQNAVTFQMFSAFLEPFALWLVLTILIYIVATIGSKGARFSDVLTASGWALTPLIFAGITRTLGAIVALGDVDVPEVPGSGSVMQQELVAYNGLIEQLQADMVYTGAVWVSILFVLSCGILLVYAVKHATGYSKRGSYVLGVLPIVVYAGWLVSQLL